MQRQQVLYQPAKQVQVVMLEGALRAVNPSTLLRKQTRRETMTPAGYAATVLP